MAITLTHATVAVGTDAENGEIGKAEWNAGHSVSGTLDVANGGTGSATAADARTALGLAIGTNVQAFGAVLDDMNTLGANASDGEFIVGTGAGALAWESGATVRTSLGLGSLATASTINNDNWSGTDLSIANGGTGISANPLHTIWVPASAMWAPTTNGAPLGQTELTAINPELNTRDFDTAADEFAQFCIQMPKSWNEGTITAQFLWTAASGSGTVLWNIQAVAFADSDAANTAFGTSISVTDTLLTADDVHISSVTSAVTVAGTPGTSELVYFQVWRDVSGDSLGVDAKLIGVTVLYTADAYTDT